MRTSLKEQRPTQPEPLTGLAVVSAIALTAWLLVALASRVPGLLQTLPLSMMLIAILIGLGLAGMASSRPKWQPGLELARGPILKIAVALIGLRLSLADLGQLGFQALPLVVLVVTLGLGMTLLLARLVGAHWRLAALLAAGTAICGASAIAAAAPGLKASSTETCYAVACIALIGLLATLAYPPLLSLLLDRPEQIGLVIGVAIHDTAQVTAAAVFHEQAWATEGALASATVAKLMRNSTMLLVIPVLVWYANRDQTGNTASVPFPLFIVAFIALSGVRTLGDAWLGSDQATWNQAIAMAGQLSLFGFAMAMAALAMSIRLSELKTLGWKPAAAALVSAVGILLIALGWVFGVNSLDLT
jgi:uncharacterized integral membrane protein (TIGR00698 family)